VLLPNYAPLKVAENFLTLHALFPGRIDLGIGRAPRQNALQSAALRGDSPLPDDFAGQLAELGWFLQRRFPPGHRFAELNISPAVSDAPDLWLLGSSPASAALAAEHGLPYAYGHFIEPQWTRAALTAYRSRFAGPWPHVAGGPILTVGVICAETEAEAIRQFASTRLLYRQLGQGISGPLPAPDDAVATLGPGSGPLMPENGEWPHYIVGSAEQVKSRLDEMIAALEVPEIMVASLMYDHGARLRSYELLARMLL
jgi:luciferase family oxidoreductase group 1